MIFQPSVPDIFGGSKLPPTFSQTKRAADKTLSTAPDMQSLLLLRKTGTKKQAYFCMPPHFLFSGERKKHLCFQFKLRTMSHRYHLYRVHSSL